MTTGNDLLQALHDGEFDVAYQPIVSFASSQIISIEALLRWPSRPDVEVSQLVSEIEDHDSIAEFGEWVLERACAQLARWRLEFPVTRGWTMGVNVSALQIAGDAGPRLVRAVSAALSRNRLDGDALCLEITESSPLRASPVVSQTLNQLRNAGVLLAIDDFGTGFPSLAYLRDVSVDYIKIDRQFITDVGTSARDQELIGAMATLASNVGMASIAEGIENATQARFVASLGVEYGQGFYFSKPMSGKELSRRLRDDDTDDPDDDATGSPAVEPAEPPTPRAIPRSRRSSDPRLLS